MIPKVVNHAILDRIAMSAVPPIPNEPPFTVPPQVKSSCKISNVSDNQSITFVANSAEKTVEGDAKVCE